MLDAGREAEQRGDYSSAQAYYRSAYERDSKNLNAALALTRILRRLSRPREAIAIAERALQTNEGHPQLMAELGKSQLAANDTLDAIETLSRAGSLLPDDWEIQSALGVGYDRIGMYDQAAERYEKALNKSPGNGVVLNNYALSLAQIGELDRAIEMLEKATALPERTAQMRQNLALLYAMNGRIEEAERLVHQDLAPEVAAENLAYYRHLARNSNRGMRKLPAGVPGAGSDSGIPASDAPTVAGPSAPSAPVTPVAQAELPKPEKQDANAKAAAANATKSTLTTDTASAATAGTRIEAGAEPVPALETVASSGRAEKDARRVNQVSSVLPVDSESEPVATTDAEESDGQPGEPAVGLTAPASEAREMERAMPSTSAEAAPDATSPTESTGEGQQASEAVARGMEGPSYRQQPAAYDDSMIAASLQAATAAQSKPARIDPKDAERRSVGTREEISSEQRATPASLPIASTSASSPSVSAGPIYRVQLGSYRNEGDANHGISRLREAHDDILASVELDIIPVTLPERGAYFRVLTAPFPTHSAAAGVCDALQSREVSCFVRRD